MRWSGEIVGHRGAAGAAPENTMASFEAAIALGARRVEFDVRRTLDGHAVVFHDLDIERFLPGQRTRTVSRRSLRDMLAIDVGAALGRPGCPVPSLEEALERLAGRVLLNVEVKGAGVEGLLTLPLAIAALRRHRLTGSAVLSTFHVPVLRRARDEAPDIPRALIVDRRFQGDAVKAALALGCEGLHPHHPLADAPLQERCQAEGLRLRAWTANEPADIERLMLLGVDGIVSDFPGRVRELRDTMRDA